MHKIFIKNTEISYYNVYVGDKLLRICPCYDAELFSEDVLRLLLLTDDGSQVKWAAAISFSDSLTVRLVSLN
ncbi:MAG: hypothetical protein IJW93_07455 [Clostridia bacterium]|nr:hypothetical protein [Clostridia bacterium]